MKNFDEQFKDLFVDVFVKEAFVNRLNSEIESRNLTQQQAAELTGITQASFSHYLSGKRTPAFCELYKICKGLKVSADYLLGIIS